MVKARRPPYKRSKVTLVRTITAAAPKRVELKYDNGQVITVIPIASTLALLSTIASGAAVNQRVGRHIAYHALEYNYHIYPQVGSVPFCQSRILFIYDRQPNGVLPVVLDIMENTNISTLQRQDTKQRFRVLYDKTHSMGWDDGGVSGTITYGNTIQHSEGVIDLKGLKAQFTGATNGIGDIEQGAIYTLLMATNNLVNNINMNERLLYVDA